MCIFLSGAEKLRYKQPKAELKNNYIPGMDGYLQDLPGVMKLINNFFSFGPVSVSPHHAHSWVVELQSHNRGHIDTILCPSDALKPLHYIPCLQFLPVVSYQSVYSPPISSYPSAVTVAHALAPARSILSCSHHL